jgi:hypothetical protein
MGGTSKGKKGRREERGFMATSSFLSLLLWGLSIQK